METTERRYEHGTWGSYVNGHCPCAACKQAWADYNRARRHRRGAQPRADLRFYEAPYGRRGFDVLTEALLDAAAARTGRSWRDVVGRLVRAHGATVRFPEVAETVN